MNKIILACLLVILCCSNAFALNSIKKEGVYLYYPDGEEALASSLIAKLDPIKSFLKSYGLIVPKPLHVIIDEKKDYPGVAVHVIPHYEIRIPIKAPGVLDEGYMEEDPWGYFLFKGMCLESVYTVRSGLPNVMHYVFGEVMSPNGIMAPWFDEGFSSLMYKLYCGRAIQDSYDRAIFMASLKPDIAKLSNHPGIWPGHFAYRIFGRPFIEWVYDKYGMNRMMDFIKVHGNGIMPLEIDLKAREVFGKTWHEMWEDFMRETAGDADDGEGVFIQGYWPEPFIYWNNSGVYPGVERNSVCGRYGYRDTKGTLWLQEYDWEGKSRIVAYMDGFSRITEVKHVWDAGPGDVAVTRKGHVPYLIDLKSKDILGIETLIKSTEFIPGPPGAIQISGPVRDARGRIAVSANTKGNWDIWVYDKSWTRMTDSPSTEMDPWWDGETLLYSSDLSGTFQIYTLGMVRLTDTPHGAVMPRGGKYLSLMHKGWKMEEYKLNGEAGVKIPPIQPTNQETMIHDTEKGKKYNPLNSLFPNWMIPDLYADLSDVQIGLVTYSRDVSTDYTLNAGFRYSFYEDYLSARIGGEAKGLGLNLSRYPLDYSSDIADVDESRLEGKLSYRPLNNRWLEFSYNWLGWEDREGGDESGDDIWGAVSINKIFGSLGTSLSYEYYSGGMSSAYASLRLKTGKEIFSVFSLSAAKTWGNYEPGHGSFRMGGDVGEGYFTRRPSRLYPLRGFPSSTFEAGQAYTAGAEVYWPLANLQKGYKTIPLFLHRLKLGTFVDSGICSDVVSTDDIALGAGIELVTSMEIAWGVMTEFRFGIALPVVKPDYIDSAGYVVLLQIGRPL